MIRPSCVRRLGAAALALWFGIFMAESVMKIDRKSVV